MEAMFYESLKDVLAFEGGYSNDPKDPGGETNLGITKAVYDAYRKSKKIAVRSVKFIDKKEVEDIYYNLYWLKTGCDKVPAKWGYMMFDTAVNCGVSRSVKIAQESLVRLGVKTTVDGKIGPNTIKSINSVVDVDNSSVKTYIKVRNEFYDSICVRNSNLLRFIKGWKIRTKKIEDKLCK